MYKMTLEKLDAFKKWVLSLDANTVVRLLRKMGGHSLKCEEWGGAFELVNVTDVRWVFDNHPQWPVELWMLNITFDNYVLRVKAMQNIERAVRMSSVADNDKFKKEVQG